MGKTLSLEKHHQLLLGLTLPATLILRTFPQNKEITNTKFQSNDAFLASFQINYRPTLKKQYRNSIRYVDFSSSPLITFKYRGAIPKVFGTEIDFHTIELGNHP